MSNVVIYEVQTFSQAAPFLTNFLHRKCMDFNQEAVGDQVDEFQEHG